MVQEVQENQLPFERREWSSFKSEKISARWGGRGWKCLGESRKAAKGHFSSLAVGKPTGSLALRLGHQGVIVIESSYEHF